jgi:ethanolamine utilization protein EutN
VFDELGAGRGAIIGISEGGEAANAFWGNKVPIDAYCACLLDRINV